MPWRDCLQGEEEEKILVEIWRLCRHKPVRQQVLRGWLASALGECQMATTRILPAFLDPRNTDVTHRYLFCVKMSL